MKKFSRSEVKGQGHSETKCTFAAEAYISTAWRIGSHVLAYTIIRYNTVGI